MRTEKIEKVYKSFNELSEEQQQKVLDNNRYVNVDIEEWNDYIIEEFLGEVRNNTIIELEHKDVIWEVGGRDAKFGVYSKPVINQLLDKFEGQVLDIETPNKLGSFLNHQGGGVCSKNHTELNRAGIEFEDDVTKQDQEKISDEINKQIDTIIELCSKYHDKNEKEFEYLTSDEAVRDAIEMSDMEFDIDTL